MFYLILFSDLAEFRNLGIAFQTCFTIMLNKFDFGKIKETNTIAAVMFFFFAVSVSWILVNVLLTIIIDGYEKVKKELEGQKNELEVIQYIKDCFRSMAGYQERPHFLLEFAPGGSRHEELVVDKPEDEIRAEEYHTILNDLPNKVDDFLECINKIYFDGQMDLTTKSGMKKEFETKKEAEDNEGEEQRLVKSPNLSMVDPEWAAMEAEFKEM